MPPKAKLKGPKYRHPMDAPTMRSLLHTNPKHYKAVRMAQPHFVLSEKDSVFERNWGSLLDLLKRKKISKEEYERRFFREVTSALERRRASR